MSLDTLDRVITYFGAQIETAESIYTIYDDNNFGEPDDGGGGPWCRVMVESSFDDMTGLNPDLTCYAEEGIVIIQVYCDAGLGNIDLRSHARLVTLIRDAFRNVTLPQSGNQEGAILFKDITSSLLFDDPSDYDTEYKRKDIFINYVKDYAVVVPPLYWLNDGTGGLSNPWNNAEFWSNR